MIKSEYCPEFERYVAELIKQHDGKRIHYFRYQKQGFWLKQPDKLKGIWKILKPNPLLALRKEIHQLQLLNADGAPVPRLVLSGKDFMVLEDAGRSANLCIEDNNLSPILKQTVLNDCAKALTELHKQGFIHGRPVLRDIVWQADRVTFIDFEEHSEENSERNNLQWQKVRDSLIFIHSLFRTKVIKESQEYAAVMHFKQHCDEEIWQALTRLLKKYRWLYYLLRPFKPIAKMDLIAVYKIFEHLVLFDKQERK